MFNKFREQYSKCVYHGYTLSYEENKLVVDYAIEIVGLDIFHTKWRFPLSSLPYFDEKDEMCQRLLFGLGMSELISYYKLTCSPVVEVKDCMGEEEKVWWTKLFYHGLGEFLYRNNIDVSMNDLVRFESLGGTSLVNGCTSLHGALVPIGGGKDSITSLELLRGFDFKKMAYIINTRGACEQSALIAGYTNEDVVAPQRTLDKKILDYNKQGFLNGHIPFSAMVAFSATFVAYCNHLQFVILSNEASANESSVKGSSVNHQYSKSLEFENDFRAYLSEFVGCKVEYFSLLRPLSEYQIGRYFASLKEYHGIFRSCNLGSKNDAWCCNCAKCLYVYVLLSAFLNDEELLAIFHANLLQREDMFEMFMELIGLRDSKPFECVGSIDEINFAIIDAIKMRGIENLPYLYQEYRKCSNYETYLNKENPYLEYFEEGHNVPSFLVDVVKKEMTFHA